MPSSIWHLESRLKRFGNPLCQQDLVSVVMLAIPLSLIGGLLALFIAQYNFSVAVWVGFIALFGNAVETGVVIVLYLDQAVKKARRRLRTLTEDQIQRAILEGATKRLRPVLMTAFTSIIGLMPMLLSTGTGSEVQKPLAVVVVGGLLTSVFMTMVVIPVLFGMLIHNSHALAEGQTNSTAKKPA